MAEKKHQHEDKDIVLVRILGQDIPGDKNVYTGLTRIKGISWGISNLICKKLKLSKKTKIDELGKETIKKIEDFVLDMESPSHLKNRRADRESGETSHLHGIKLDLKKDFDIKRMKQTKSYKGDRHSRKLPVRGQRTRSHFRKSGIAVGVKKPKMGKKS